MSNPVVVLGATGSIGRQTLEVVDRHALSVAGLAARNPTSVFADLVRAHPDALVVLTGGTTEERAVFAASVPNRVVTGPDEMVGLAATKGATVVNAIVGAAGLRASIAALEAGNRLALANKESMVAAGPLITKKLAKSGELIPIDSEHSALHQCLLGEDPAQVAGLVLTASGGPFRGKSRADLADVTPAEALAHPTWNMGKRITIDSATMFNKALEVIEAHHLFEVGYDRINVVIHPQSVVHSLVEFVDGSMKAHLGLPDMRIPIQYALTAPSRLEAPGDPFSLAGTTLDFEWPDYDAFPAVQIGFDAGRRGGSAPATLNAADEVAVESFLQGRLGFLGIAEVVANTLEMVERRPLLTVDDVMEVDRESRAAAAALIAGMC